MGHYEITQATSNYVHPLNPMGHNVIDGKFVCPIIEGNHHGTNQSEMHQIWEFVSSHNCPSQSKGQFQLFNNGNTIILYQIVMAPPHLTLSPAVWDFYFDNWITYHYELQKSSQKWLQLWFGFVDHLILIACLLLNVHEKMFYLCSIFKIL